MTREPSLLARSLRAVALAITMVALTTFSTVGYSAYVGVGSVIGTLGGDPQTPALAASTVVHGLDATVYLNVTLANEGLYPIELSMICLPQVDSRITCNSPTITVPPGESRTLSFEMTVENYSQVVTPNLRVDGQVKVSLDPFASVSARVDLGALAARGVG